MASHNAILALPLTFPLALVEFPLALPLLSLSFAHAGDVRALLDHFELACPKERIVQE